MSFGKDSLWKNKSNELQVGYTSELDIVTFSSNLKLDLKKPALKRLHISTPCKILEPDDIGACEVFITTSAVPALILDSGVRAINTSLELLAGYDYILTLRRYGPGRTVIQLAQIQN